MFKIFFSLSSILVTIKVGGLMRVFAFLGIAFSCLFLYSNCSGFNSLNTWTTSLSSSSFLAPQSSTPGLFKIERNAIKILPYDIRINKLKSLVGSEDSSLYTKLESKRIELGAYDYAKGAGQDLTWIDSRLTAWTEGLQPYCSSPLLRSKFPFPQSAMMFIETAMGRDVNSQDQSNIAEITAANISNEMRLELLCYVTLSSLEFVAK